MARRRPALKVVPPAPELVTSKELGNLAGNVWAAVRVLEEPRLAEHIYSFGRRAADAANEDTARYMLAVATLTATGKRLYELVGDRWSA